MSLKSSNEIKSILENEYEVTINTNYGKEIELMCKFAANRNIGYFILFMKYSVFSLSTSRKKYRIKSVRKMKLFA